MRNYSRNILAKFHLIRFETSKPQARLLLRGRPKKKKKKKKKKYNKNNMSSHMGSVPQYLVQEC